MLSTLLGSPVPEEKQTLTNHFLADGIDEVAFVFEFLPDCVANVGQPGDESMGIYYRWCPSS